MKAQTAYRQIVSSSSMDVLNQDSQLIFTLLIEQ